VKREDRNPDCVKNTLKTQSLEGRYVYIRRGGALSAFSEMSRAGEKTTSKKRVCPGLEGVFLRRTEALQSKQLGKELKSTGNGKEKKPDGERSPIVTKGKTKKKKKNTWGKRRHGRKMRRTGG